MSQRKRALTTQTTLVRKEDIPPRQWLLFDATGKTLGRLASEIAKILRGKHKPTFTPHVDTGDGVVIINAEKIVVTGNKEAQKLYRYYTGHIGGLREIPFRRLHERNPEKILQYAIAGMMPRTRLGRQQLRNLRIFKGEEHTLKAQKPLAVNI